ncbi:hypothetical protein XPA_007300 [Xanthoria parietina]
MRKCSQNGRPPQWSEVVLSILYLGLAFSNRWCRRVSGATVGLRESGLCGVCSKRGAKGTLHRTRWRLQQYRWVTRHHSAVAAAPERACVIPSIMDHGRGKHEARFQALHSAGGRKKLGSVEA